MRTQLTRNFISLISMASILFVSFFTYSFLDNRSKSMASSNDQLRSKLVELKQTENSLKSEKTKLDKQQNDLQEKLNKFQR